MFERERETTTDSGPRFVTSWALCALSRGVDGRARAGFSCVHTAPPFQVGMFEHVGRANLGAYFAKISLLVAPEGIAMNHGITLTDSDIACSPARAVRPKTRPARAVKIRNTLAGNRIPKRPAAPRADQTHLQHHSISGGFARCTEKEVEKISRLPAKALFPAGRPSPPSIVGPNGARPR